MGLIQEIALELNIKTGQVYTCPEENIIQGPSHAYWVRPRTYPKPERLAVDWTGPKNKGHKRTETITLDPKRKPEAIAADILRRLPPAQAIEYYTEAQKYLEREAERDRKYKTAQDFFSELKFRPYAHQNGSDQFHKDYMTVGFYRSDEIEITLKLERLTNEEAAKVIELIESMKPPREKGK